MLRAALFVFLATSCTAQPARPANEPKTPAVPAPEKLGPRDKGASKDADELRISNANRSRIDTRRNLYYLWGNVQFQDKEMSVVCDEASYNQNDDTASCAGSITMKDAESVITGTRVNADFGAKIIIVVGGVKIVTTKAAKAEDGKADSAEQRTTTITCDKLQYYYTEGKRRAVATGNVKAVQKDRTVIAQRADLDREQDIITLGDDVTITMDNGNEFHCTKATVSTTEDWVNMDALKGKVVREKKGGEGAKAGGKK